MSRELPISNILSRGTVIYCTWRRPLALSAAGLVTVRCGSKWIRSPQWRTADPASRSQHRVSWFLEIHSSRCLYWLFSQDVPGITFTVPKNLPTGEYVKTCYLLTADLFNLRQIPRPYRGDRAARSLHFWRRSILHFLRTGVCHWWWERHARTTGVDPRRLHWPRAGNSPQHLLPSPRQLHSTGPRKFTNAYDTVVACADALFSIQGCLVWVNDATWVVCFFGVMLVCFVIRDLETTIISWVNNIGIFMKVFYHLPTRSFPLVHHRLNIGLIEHDIILFPRLYIFILRSASVREIAHKWRRQGYFRTTTAWWVGSEFEHLQ